MLVHILDNEIIDDLLDLLFMLYLDIFLDDNLDLFGRQQDLIDVSEDFRKVIGREVFKIGHL